MRLFRVTHTTYTFFLILCLGLCSFFPNPPLFWLSAWLCNFSAGFCRFLSHKTETLSVGKVFRSYNVAQYTFLEFRFLYQNVYFVSITFGTRTIKFWLLVGWHPVKHFVERVSRVASVLAMYHFGSYIRTYLEIKTPAFWVMMLQRWTCKSWRFGESWCINFRA